VHPTRQAPRSPVLLRAIVAAALAFGLILVLAAQALAAPSVSIDAGPSGPTNDTMPLFEFTVDVSATTVECSIDQGLPLYLPCSETYQPLIPLPDGDYTFRVHAGDGVEDTFVTQTFTVDTVPPSLSIGSGPSGPTNDATPSFGFTVEDGASVECSIDQGSPAYASCASPYTPGAPLADGSYAFRVRARDAAGNQATDSQAFSVDATPPSLSIDSGPSGATNDRTPTFGFTAELDADVECSIDQGSPSYDTCTRSTSHTAGALADGSYTFRVHAIDAVGNEVIETQSFTVDATPPSVSIDSGPTGLTSDSTPSFGFTADVGADVECSIDQGLPVYAPCSSSYTPGAPLADGGYTFRVRARDAAGNVATDSQTFTVDATPPDLTIDSGPSGLTNDRTPTFGFTTDTPRVQCSVDQGSPAYGSCTRTTSHTASALVDGSYTFRIRGTDAAGNEAIATRSFTVDATPPSLSIDFGPAGPTNERAPSFGFTAEAGAAVECSIDQGTPTYELCTSPYGPSAPLSDGNYSFRVRATDAAGNRTTRAQAFSVDSAAPSLLIDSGPAGPTNDTTPSFGFTAEAGTRVQCSLDQAAYGPCTSATTYAIGTPLAQGTHTFRVQARDGSGNDAIVQRTFTVDTVPPALSIDFGPSGTTSDSTPLFGFTAERGATTQCSIDQGTPAFGPCASATTHAAGAPLADGAYVFRVRATDAASNGTTATRAFTVDTVPDTPPPATPIPTPDPAPPTTTPSPSATQLLSPFPLVRISGTLTSTGVRIRLLSVRAPRGAIVRVSVTPACSRTRPSSRRCSVLRAGGTVGRRAVIGFRALARAYRSGTVIVVRVWRADRIGKYTRFTIVRGKAPRRVDQCLVPGATRGSRCPSG
jgi:Bacterial Ig-like domain